MNISPRIALIGLVAICALAAHAGPRDAAPAIDPEKAYELPELIDIAERTNPETRIAWEQAREAAFNLGIAKSAYAPTLAAKAVALTQHVSSPLPKNLNPEGFMTADTQAFLPTLTFRWLLFDFGGKEATLDAAEQSLAAANFGFSFIHLKIVLDVTRAYYAVIDGEGRVEAASAALALAATLQDAAESRRSRGLATLPEVLQAREQAARAAYDLQGSMAAQVDARMALLQAMGVRPTTPIRVAGPAPRELPARLGDSAEKLVDRALEQRPDLMARVAAVRAREADTRKAQSEFYPRIDLGGDLGRNIGRVRTAGAPGWSGVHEPSYGVGISIEVPIFDGGLRRDRLGVARSRQRVAEEELERARDDAARQVVKAHEDLKVALSRREAAVKLLEAATRSYEAAIDSYRMGVATFVDVANAQTALARARTADVDSISAIYTAAASLAFSTGEPAPDAFDRR